MKLTFKKDGRKAERGNVLFLILIAVALFAALSYAVTSSSRSGGSDANNESNLVNSATVTQYPASVRTSIIRMILSNSVDPNDLMFNPPAQFGDTDFVEAQGVFHPNGGGATFTAAPPDVVTLTTTQDWIFNAENEINLIGVTSGTEDAPTDASADIIAFLPNVTDAICRRINEEVGIGATIPVETNALDLTTEMENTTGINSTAGGGGTIGGTGAAALDAQPFGCFEDSAGVNHYYHVLIER